MIRSVSVLLASLLFLTPIAAPGDNSPERSSPTHLQPLVKTSANRTRPKPATALNVVFAHNRLSVHVQNVSLKPLLEEIAHQTGLTVTVSPTFTAIPVTVELSQIEVEPALQEILRRAGIANAAWIYRKKTQFSNKQEDWELSRLNIIAEGHDSTLVTDTTVSPTQPKQQTTTAKKLAHEQFRDTRTNRLIDVAAREVLVRLDPKMSADEMAQKIARLHAEVIDQIAQVGMYHLLIPDTDTVSSFIDKHQKDPRLQLLEPNPIVSVEPTEQTPNDPFFRAQWSLERIGAPQAWTHLPNHAGGIVAVIDSGVDPHHPELQGHLLSGKNLIDQNDDTTDQHGHGTAIAGIVAATTNNAIGMSGICPTCRILPVKVLNESGEGTYASVIAGIVWAADRHVEVMNLSLGSYGFSRMLADAVEYAYRSGAVLVAAGGNEATQAPLYPGALPNVLSVAATDIADNLWTGSNYGSAIDLTAPGVRVLSLDLHNSYMLATGTSFSAAQVSGVAALVRTKHPALKNTQVTQVLFQTADDLGEKGKDQFYGAGRINAARAMRVEVRPF